MIRFPAQYKLVVHQTPNTIISYFECFILLISIKLDEVIYIKNLVFVRASDKSLHKEWIEPKNAKTFELYIEYYGEHPKRYREDADYYSHNQTGTKFRDC